MQTEAESLLLEDIKNKSIQLRHALQKLPPVHESIKSIERLTESFMWATQAVLSPSEI